ncbi:MAG: DNA mismatch repair endonuclease MutL, partial [SAR202 cluster bacterium]|nr:DNA mismatch repair endonuclease MutL [SAR202 cluster bacterium]
MSAVSIRVLPPNVAASIAAGEVIERPASVVKELVENALDAGATAIAVEIRQGGMTSIRVADDGHGIPADELELAFERHATSKLATLDDLERIATMGFRGEALPSIVASAHVRMTSRPADSDSAAFVEFDGGRLTRHGRESAAPGTTVLVEALFSSIPARLKFLRSAATETGRVHQAIDHLALAHPRVRFTLRADGKTMTQTPGSGNLRDAVAAIHGAAIAEALVDLAPSPRATYRVHGLVSPPSVSRSNRNDIGLFVNRRWIQHRALVTAVEEAYAGLLMEGRFPVAVVFVDVPTNELDVNVHPHKREVRFAREGDAFSSVQRTVRETLLAAFPIADARSLLPSAPPGQPPSPRPWAPASAAFDFTLRPRTG